MVCKTDLIYWGLDDFGRPVFKKAHERNVSFYYCSTNEILREGEDTQEKLDSILNAMIEGKDELHFKGIYPDGEPDYPVKLNP